MRKKERAPRRKVMLKNLCLIFGAAALVASTPLSAAPRGDEPVAVPSSVKQGIDFVYVDPEMSNVAKKQKPRNWLQRIFGGSREQSSPNPLFLDLAQGLQRYQATWGALPDVTVPAGPVLKRGSKGKRVDLLRTRLGLSPGGGYDDVLFQRVSEYQRVHGLGTPDGIVGKVTLASLNRGAEHYERRIAINMERAWRLPATGAFDRYVIVDSGAAETYLFERDRLKDSMKVIVGTAKTKTPMMAVLMHNAKANPYWNVPPDMIADVTAKRVLARGTGYLKDFHYEVLSEWSPQARVLDPKEVNWKQVAAGKSGIWVRQLPGPWNSMGAMKFEMPNDYGIYLHDTPTKALFERDDRWLSNGCVRLEDYRRFATWVFGEEPKPTVINEMVMQLPKPVPVYMTYLTVEMGEGGIVFRADPYGFDAEAMPQMFDT